MCAIKKVKRLIYIQQQKKSSSVKFDFFPFIAIKLLHYTFQKSRLEIYVHVYTL